MIFKRKNLTHFKKGLIFVIVGGASCNAIATQTESEIINKAVQAYGGEKLLKLQTLQYKDSIDHFFSHQSGHSMQGPVSTHLNQITLEVKLDLTNQYSELKRAARLVVGYHDEKNLTTTHRVFYQGQGYSLDHCLGEFRLSDQINYNNADLGYSHMLDPLIVKDLADKHNVIKWVDSAFIEGAAHDVLEVDSKSRGQYSVYIHQKTGFLSRMLQPRGDTLRTYNFLDHQTSGDIAWAKQMFVGVEGQPLYHTREREISVNSRTAFSFRVPEDYQLSGSAQPVDVSELTIQELAEGVYHVGQGWGYTFFVDVGEYYISAGAWGMSDRSDDWTKALTLLHKTTGNSKPVKQHLVSHHHTDHMSELHDVLQHGAKLLVHPGDITSVKMFLNDSTIAEDQFIPVVGKTHFGNGKVMIFDVPSSQASHNLVMFLPAHNIIFSEDFFGSSYVDGHHSPVTWPHMDTYQRLSRLTDSLESLGIEAEQFVSSHHQRVLSKQDINEASEISCPGEEEYLDRLFSTSLNQ